MPERQPVKMDHYPVVTILELAQERMLPKTSQNYSETDWAELNIFLERELTKLLIPAEI